MSRSYKEYFPSRYLKAEDLHEAHVTGTIVSCGAELVGQPPKQEERLVLGFKEPYLKPLVMNKVNCEAVAKIAGDDDPESWIGQKITVYASETTFGGKTVPCVRVKAPKKDAPKIASAPAEADAADPIPF